MNRSLAGRYELEAMLGRGGSGTVWRGRDLVTRQEIAVKFVEIDDAGDPGELAETIGRFRREAKLVAGLRHPNMVAALDAGRIGNELYLVMELAHGISLAQMTTEREARGMGLLPVASVLRIADEVSVGLATAHAAGVVHRDIKPGNLMVTAQLNVKIVDFGIARLLNDSAPRLTRQGYTVGTPAYMSPEQARDQDVDGRTDIYSLGCVLYELLSGAQPFQGATSQEVMMLQLEARAAPLREVRPDLLAGLCDLVAEMMRKDRETRPVAGEVIRRLLAVSGGLTGDAATHEADRRTAMPGDQFGVPTGPSRVIRGATQQVTREPTRDATRQPTRDATRQPTRDATRGAAREPTRDAARDAISPPAGWPAPAPGWPARPQAAEPPGPRAKEPAGAWAAAAAAAPPDWAAHGPAAQYAPEVSAPGMVPPATGGGSAPAPAWPEPSKRRPPRRWRRIISSLITAAIVAGVGGYLWVRDHETLKITGVQAGSVSETVGCDGIAVIPGVIDTNSHGGTINYEWIYSKGQGTGPLVVQDASGSSTVQVTGRWQLRGNGTGQVHAELVVLAPDHAESDISFSYSCTP